MTRNDISVIATENIFLIFSTILKQLR